MSWEHGFVTRGVTTIEWPYIPDEKIKDWCEQHANDYNYRKGSTFDLSAILEHWTDETEDEISARAEPLMAFRTKYNLPEDTIVNFWW